jgi:1A family penicillin-binding protein
MNKFISYFKNHPRESWIFLILGVGIICAGVFVIWITTLTLPDFKSFTERKVQSSTKIYDNTGKILLYDVHQDIKRTIIPYEDMGVSIKNATVAIEDSEFYQHKGIRITSIIRATVWAKITGRRVQGGSTITQQLIKNTLLTNKRSLTRKIKEWILAIKLERVMTKDDILALYLNEAPYGGNIYGIAEASKAFFGKEPKDMTLAESAYMAAIPNGPTYYSPYGKNKARLDDRKNLVLKRMLDLKFITQEEHDSAVKETVTFLPASPLHIAAPHFVFFVKEYLEQKYGPETLDAGGLTVITTLDYELQKKTEAIALEKATINEKEWNGKNTAVVVIDPKTGHIRSMVGSRNYFDKTVDGNFNVATAQRQPGSSFKPIIFARAFEDGYTEQTTLFDVKTEFNSSCSPLGVAENKNADCYMPDNYDNAFRGPMTLRDGLAQSINIIAVKLLYLVGVQDSIKLAHDLGITTLTEPDRYGLSLVIGGGETTLLDMTSVYSVFANNGIRNPHQSILEIKDSTGTILETYEPRPYQVLQENTTRILSSILSDNKARTPTFGANSPLVVPGHDVAVKTGTTNNNRDAWTIGYTPYVTVGVWVGNNDNTPMKKGGAALAGPIWNQVLQEALVGIPSESFNTPDPIDETLPPVLRGFWQGGDTFTIDSVSGNLATEFTPKNKRKEISITNVHTILYWIDKNNPQGPRPTNPQKDSQFKNWEYGVLSWWNAHKQNYKIIGPADKPTRYDTIHTGDTLPYFDVQGISEIPYTKNQNLAFSISPRTQTSRIQKIDIYINNSYSTSLKQSPFSYTVPLSNLSLTQKNNTIRIVAYNENGEVEESEFYFSVEL